MGNFVYSLRLLTVNLNTTINNAIFAYNHVLVLSMFSFIHSARINLPQDLTKIVGHHHYSQEERCRPHNILFIGTPLILVPYVAFSSASVNIIFKYNIY